VNADGLVRLGWAFFHEPSSTLSLACFRVAFSACLVINAALLLLELDGVFAWEAALDRVASRRPAQATRARHGALLWGHLAACVALAAGLLTPIAAALVWLTTYRIYRTIPPATYGADRVALIMSFLLVFAPAAEHLSVDRALDLPWARPGHAIWAFRLMQMQVVLIYVRSAFAKLKNAGWRDGTAIYYVVTSVNLQRLELPRPLQRAWFYRFATYVTLLIELQIGVLVLFPRLRPWSVAAVAAMHLGIECLVNVQLFGWFMFACLVLLVDPALLPTWLGR